MFNATVILKRCRLPDALSEEHFPVALFENKVEKCQVDKEGSVRTDADGLQRYGSKLHVSMFDWVLLGL